MSQKYASFIVAAFSWLNISFHFKSVYFLAVLSGIDFSNFIISHSACHILS